jgi:dephospho-CoA kinase
VLNRIVHPRVFEAIEEERDGIRKSAPGSVVILDIPLLFETGTHRDLAEIIVVYAPESVQLTRLMKRNGLSQRDALARIRSQMPIEQKKQRASLVIDNSGDRQATRRQTLAIYRSLSRRA